jgi:hypothetical protein
LDPHIAHWFIYAMGGGLGHLTRSVALARAARRRGVRCTILANSPFVKLVPVAAELGPDDRLIEVSPDLDRDAVARRVAQCLRETVFDLLIVDAFPRGLGGELVDVLPTLSVPRVLVHRDLNPAYVEQYQLADFVQLYDCLLLPGESGPLADARPSFRTAPWLMRDVNELLPRADARRVLAGDIVDDRPLVLVSGSGRAEEIDEMHDVARWLTLKLAFNAQVCFVEPRAKPSHRSNWPVFQYIAGVDVSVGAGGCNTVSECRATGTPLIAFARKRLYDRQSVRLKSHEAVLTRDELLARLRGTLDSLLPTRQPVSFINGTNEAVEFLLRS